ncbi:hypothetical protein FB567DRAFT_87865 [Paraphoma chrysanthemicola]|uniref:Zn(2)-C6 fungal-type domain-containing protein n=1 Tax=Paraphoma chrysanthemicola TaxID=798071 RepID=A0A8K0VWI2_9PLEO|nr:hypothetical protein FB567DRAFT_87865 [Paraphoma chrysanthemicola]
MVYRGKPSAACGECRKRRSRCDQATPACTQCVKAGRACPGYRNTVDLMFHDESKQIARRNKDRTTGKTNEEATGSNSRGQLIKRTAKVMPVKLTDFVLYQPLDDIGVSFFMSTYVGEDPAISQLYYLPKFYAKTGYAHVGLQKSIIAAGLAGYAKIARRKEITNSATKHYVAAIQGINAALSDPTTAAQDSTLLSIIMAAMFEILIIPRLGGTQNCSKHLEGAVSVALLRLKHGGQTDVTHNLLTTLVQSIIINCWISHVPLPRNFVELDKQLVRRKDVSSIHSQFLDIVLELVRFREDLQNNTLRHPMTIIHRALAIDKLLVEFAEDLPPQAQFRVCKISSKSVQELAYEGYFHIYPQRFTAHLWNNIRSSRTRLHQVVLRQCHILRASSGPKDVEFLNRHQTESEARILEQAIEISATVPQLAGYLEQLEPHFNASDHTLPARFSERASNLEPGELPHFAKRVASAAVEYSSHFVYDPNPLPPEASHSGTKRTPSLMSIFYSECNDGEPKLDAPAHIAPPLNSNTPQPGSLYHMLFQLYGLQCIPLLPESLRRWMFGRTRWMEIHSDVDDLARLQEMIIKKPGDGFPVDEERYVKHDFLRPL